MQTRNNSIESGDIFLLGLKMILTDISYEKNLCGLKAFDIFLEQISNAYIFKFVFVHLFYINIFTFGFYENYFNRDSFKKENFNFILHRNH